MNAVGDLEFAHRLNADATFESICMSCFLTIGTTENELALAGQEKMHPCNCNDIHIHLVAQNGSAADH